MIVILNGSLGVGKSSTAKALLQIFQRAVLLGCDDIGRVHPFEIYCQKRIDHLNRTVALLVDFHRSAGHPNFVIEGVFETPEQLTALTELLRPLDPHIRAFRLTCGEEEQRRRAARRGRDDLAWEMSRLVELNGIQERSAMRGDIGLEVDTTGMTATLAAQHIWALLEGTHRPAS